METDKINVNSDGKGLEQALEETERFAQYIGLSQRNALRLRLLAEETLSMVRAIVGGFDAKFWIESTPMGGARIHLSALVNMDYDKKQELIAVSTNKANSASVGVMGKIRELVENSLYHLGEIENLRTKYGDSSVMYGMMGMSGLAAMQPDIHLWSLEQYRKNVEETKETDEAVQEAWDELEKSIVANIADDVRVAISGDKVEMVIEKRAF